MCIYIYTQLLNNDHSCHFDDDLNICLQQMLTHTGAARSQLPIYIYIYYVNIYIYTYMCTCINIYVHIYIPVRSYINVYAHQYIHIYLYTQVLRDDHSSQSEDDFSSFHHAWEEHDFLGRYLVSLRCSYSGQVYIYIYTCIHASMYI